MKNIKNCLVTISIVSWNNEETIKDCIKSILNQTYSNFELIIVDNKSHDRTIPIIKKIEDQRIKIHVMHKNTGYCGGHNYSVAISKGKYLLLVNPDITMKSNYLQNAITFMNKNASVGTLAGLLLQDKSNNPLIDSAGMLFSKDRRFKLRFNNKHLSEVRIIEGFVPGVDGALPFYRSSMIKDISINGKFFDKQ